MIGRAGQSEAGGHVAPVDQRDSRAAPQRRDRARHRPQRRAADVVAVDLLGAGEGERDGDRLGEDRLRQRFAPRRGQRLRIVEALGQVVGIENHRADADRPGERPAADLVDARDEAAPCGDQRRARCRNAGRPSPSAERAGDEPREIEGEDVAQQLDEALDAVVGGGLALGRASPLRLRRPRRRG